MYEARMNNCIKLHNKLGESTYKDQVMKELRELFYDSKFMEKLDSNVNLFAFENHLQQSLVRIDRRPIAIASYQFF